MTQRNRTTIEFWETDEAWKATEPGGEKELYGRGDTPHEAVAHYAELAAQSVATDGGQTDG